jgi:dienelactone hydrolase
MRYAKTEGKIMISKSKLIISVILILLGFYNLSLQADENPQETQNLKDEMRLPWSRIKDVFITDWLVLGEFPNPDKQGFDKDYLTEHGGEAKIRPVEGMTHQRPDGSIAKWTKFHTKKVVDFIEAFRGRPNEHVVGYAYTTISRSQAGNIWLSLGSDDGVAVWLNGKSVHRNLVGRALSPDADQVEVFMDAGENHLLVKVEQGTGDWSLCLRIINAEDIILIREGKLYPSIEKTDTEDNKLIIRTDNVKFDRPEDSEINVEIIDASGMIVAKSKSKRGERLQFETDKWRDGVYEIYLTNLDRKGRLQNEYLLWYKGDALATAKNLVETAPKEKPTTETEIIHAMLADLVLDRIGGNFENPKTENLSDVYAALLEFQNLNWDRSAKSKPDRSHQFVRMAYRDKIDDSPQFCRVYLPTNYNPATKYPMVVMLHGYNGENPPYIRWWSVTKRHEILADRYNLIYTEPHGRGNTSYNGIGDRDVLRCIQMAKERFNVDEDRVYLTGYSMGGGGTWHVGCRHPELFAAIAPIYGGWDYHVEYDEAELAKLNEIDRFIQEKQASFAQAEALLSTPVCVAHGDADAAVDVNNSRYAVRMLQRWGYNIRYWEVPGGTHGRLGIEDDLMQWFLLHKRDANPKHVRIRSAVLKSASAHWVSVRQRKNPYAFIHADVEVIGPNKIKLETENVLELTLSPGSDIVDHKQPLLIFWNCKEIKTKLEGGRVTLKSAEYSPGKLHKRPAIEGPLADDTNTPFAVVIGTISKDSLMRKLCEMKSRDFINNWKDWQKCEPRVFKDIELSDIDMAKYSLILYGGADANSVTKKLIDKIPLKMTSNKIILAGQEFNAKDAVVNMIYPNPLNSDRYVSIIAANSPTGMYFLNQNQNNTERYDFYIADGCLPNRRLGRPQEKVQVAAGIFDYNWQIDPQLLEKGDPEIRAQCPYRKVLSDLSTTMVGLPKIDPQVFDNYIGEYKADAGFVVKIMKEGDKLMGQGPGGPPVQLFPYTETEYFLDVMDLQIIFVKDESGRINELIIHEGDQHISAKKTK